MTSWACKPLPKQISLRWPNKIASASPSLRYRQALKNRCRDAVELAHDEPAGGSEFIGQRNHSRLKHLSVRVALPPIINQWHHSRNTQRDVDQALPPRAPKGIGNDDGHMNAKCPRELLLKSACGAIRILRQQQRRSTWNVRDIYAGISTDKAVPCLGDDHAVLHPHDAACFPQHNFDHPRVLLVFSGPLFRLLGRLNRVETHDSSFRLGHNLLCHDEDISLFDNESLPLGCFHQEPCEIVTKHYFRQSHQRNNLHRRRRCFVECLSVRHVC